MSKRSTSELRPAPRTANTKEVVRGVKNTFSWIWLEDKDDHRDFLSEYVLKIDLAGFAVRQWCKNSQIKYGRKEGNVLFNDALNTFYLWLYGV